MNRELTNRIRPISNLLSNHKTVIKNDIKLAMKIIQNMDKRWNLWQEEGESAEELLSSSIVDSESEPLKDDKPMDSESTEAANLEKQAFCRLTPQGSRFLSHKVTFGVVVYFLF